MKSIISLKSIKFIALTTKTVVVIDFYRLTVSVDINENVIIDNYGIIDWFSDICFYRLHSSGRVSTEQVIVGCGWLEIWKFFLPFLHSSLVWNNLFLVKYMIDSKIVVELEIPIEKAICGVERDWNWGHQSTIAQMSWRPSTPVFRSNRYFAVFTE